MLSIFTLTSSLHDEHITQEHSGEFLSGLELPFNLVGSDYSSYGSSTLDVIYVRTGGTEGIFKELLPRLLQQSKHPFYLLTSGKSNSLAASMEILSYLRQQGLVGEIIHGTMPLVNRRLGELYASGKARCRLAGCRLGIVGKPSDWLISSTANREAVRHKLGVELLNIEMSELLEEFHNISGAVTSDLEASEASVAASLPDAEKIYLALKQLVRRYDLSGLTIRCFDLLTSLHNTGCVALARLNSEGIVAGCEGDVPAMLSMLLAMSVSGEAAFQANPATIDVERGEILFAHCTIPFSMLERYELDTHFESGIGVGIRGYVSPGDVTVLKVSGDLKRYYAEEGTLLRCEGNPGLCRTQQVIRLDNPERARYFLTEPIGNHHIIMKGRHKRAIDELLAAH